MKILKIYSLFIIMCLVVISCKKAKNKADNKTDNKPETSITVSKIQKPEVRVNSIDTFSISTSSFKDIIKRMPLKQTPIIDSTSYNSINETQFLTQQEIKTLQLTKIYPNFFKEDYNYKAQTNYKLNIHPNIITITLIIHKGENELESTLVNYNLKGKYIDHLVITYDDLVEGYVRTTSKIENNIIYKTNKTYFENEDEETWYWNINTEGKFTQITLKDVLLNRLDVKPEQLYDDFYSEQNISDTIALFVIPKIAKKEYEEYTLDANVLLVNHKTGNTIATYSEKGLWVADAIKIASIEATYNPFKISNNSETIGIKVFYFNDNPVNPYQSIELTVLELKKNKLTPVLIDFETYYKGGEIDSGNGFLVETEKTLTVNKNSSTAYFNLDVISKTKDIKLENNREILNNFSKILEELKYDNTTKTYQLVK